MHDDEIRPRAGDVITDRPPVDLDEANVHARSLAGDGYFSVFR